MRLHLVSVLFEGKSLTCCSCDCEECSNSEGKKSLVEEEVPEEESSSEEVIVLPRAKRRRESTQPQVALPPPTKQTNPLTIRSDSGFVATVIKPFYPFWIVEGESNVFIWLLRIPTCTGSISCSGAEITLSYTIARPPIYLLREKLDSDDQVFAHTQTQTCQIKIKIGAGELQPNRRLWDESFDDLYAFAGIPKLNAQADNQFTFET